MLGGDGLGAADGVLLACFAAMLPWNVLGFWNALIGFASALRRRDPVGATCCRRPTLGQRSGRSRAGGLVMPVHNEDPARVLRHLGATVASLEATGEAAAFEVFLLSDTQDRAIAAAEAAAVRALARHGPAGPSGCTTGAAATIAARRPAISGTGSSGTGARFDHMLVLDADSVMSGAAILRLVRVMEAHPEIGILQQLIVGLPNPSPFPRMFQFGMRHGMRAYTVGSAWWQGDCGPYWGHNARDPRRPVHGALPAADAAGRAAARRPRCSATTRSRRC